MGDRAIKLVDENKPASPVSTPPFEVLFREHRRRVFLAAYRISGSIHDAEDVLQSVFLRLLKRTGCVNMGEHPQHYLCRAAINASLDSLRKKRHIKALEWEEDGNLADVSALPVDRDVVNAEIQNQLRSALLSLHPRAAEIFVLRYFEDFCNAEIAEMLDTSSGTIAVTLHRTRDRLQDLLHEFEEESI